jgi:hypothetical protein
MKPGAFSFDRVMEAMTATAQLQKLIVHLPDRCLQTVGGLMGGCPLLAPSGPRPNSASEPKRTLPDVRFRILGRTLPQQAEATWGQQPDPATIIGLRFDKVVAPDDCNGSARA